MLADLGDNVSFDMIDVEAPYSSKAHRYDLPAACSMLYDEANTSWTSKGLVFGTFARQDAPIADPPAWAKRWHGASTELFKGEIHLPPRALTGWNPVGRVKKIWYRRYGAHRDDYKHTFRRRSFPLVGKELFIILRKYEGPRTPGMSAGEFFRLDCREGSIAVSWRGLLT